MVDDRAAGGRFAPGNPGGPGRPAGSRNRASLALESLMEKDAESIATKVIELANAGDLTAARLVLDRVCPPRKSRPVSFDLPGMESAADLPKALGGLLAAVADGALAPDEAASVAALIETQRKALETMELERRIAALEEGRK